MKTTQFDIVLLRHAQSIKNIKGIHGGCGEELTSLGCEQVKNVASVIRKNVDISTLKVFASTSSHTKETASIICNLFGISMERSALFRPLYLGVADGISNSDLARLYPESFQLFQKWRAGCIDIKELLIPGIESYMDFWKRGMKLLASVPHDSSSLFVCSNSLMILLTHIMLGNHPEKTDKYRHIEIGNCEIIAFKTRDYKTFTLNRNLTNVSQVLNNKQNLIECKSKEK